MLEGQDRFWYGERHAAQAFQDFFLAGHLCEMGGIRGKRDPRNLFFLERCLYLETHVDDAHLHGTRRINAVGSMRTLLQRGVKLKPVTILGQGTDLRVFAAPVHTGSGGYAH